eukprot:1160206-Pelagomonas_calceolata.AAC.4
MSKTTALRSGHPHTLTCKSSTVEELLTKGQGDCCRGLHKSGNICRQPKAIEYPLSKAVDSANILTVLDMRKKAHEKRPVASLY